MAVIVHRSTATLPQQASRIRLLGDVAHRVRIRALFFSFMIPLVGLGTPPLSPVGPARGQPAAGGLTDGIVVLPLLKGTVTSIIPAPPALGVCPKATTPAPAWTGFSGALTSNDFGDGGAATIPDCASQLFNTIVNAAKRYVGSVPASWFVTSHNSADVQVLIEGPQIFSAMSSLIERADHNVVFQTYVWESDSQAVQAILAGLSRLNARLSTTNPDASSPVEVRFIIDATNALPGKNTRL